MQKFLIVVDMQNDFIDGALGTKEAVAIVPEVQAKIEGFNGKIIYTRDTHEENYMETLEGKNLPVPHCIRGTYGWEITDALSELQCNGTIDKPTFGSTKLAAKLVAESEKEAIESITLIGLCTDICARPRWAVNVA